MSSGQDEVRKESGPEHGHLIVPGHSFASVTDAISQIVLTKPSPRAWWFGFSVGVVLLIMFLTAIVYLLAKGTGIWGVNQPVAWGFAIINLVWWIGIGHAGTLISAILLLFRQEWRTSINRFAEAMTLFAVACAALFPGLHVGRPWLAYWLFPYPNTMGLWPQFRSPLVWDFFAIATYATTSTLFWFVGLIPDLATLRDHARHKVARVVYGVLAMGWRGSARHWQRYQTAYLLLAGLATPLVLSVHSVIGLDFAVSILPGWHSTFVPPYFVAGAIFAGFAMVVTLMVPIRKIYQLEDFVTTRHLDYMGKIILATGWIVFYAYIMEAFFAWYSSNTYEEYMIRNRMTGPYNHVYYALILCNGLAPQLLWWKKWRTTPILIFIVSMFVNVGMWLERYVIVVTSLHRDFVPSSWGMYSGTRWDWMTYIGSMGLFLTLLFLFVRFLPMISIFELREMLEGEEDGHGHGPGGGVAPAGSSGPATAGSSGVAPAGLSGPSPAGSPSAGFSGGAPAGAPIAGLSDAAPPGVLSAGVSGAAPVGASGSESSDARSRASFVGASPAAMSGAAPAGGLPAGVSGVAPDSGSPAGVSAGDALPAGAPATAVDGARVDATAGVPEQSGGPHGG